MHPPERERGAALLTVLLLVAVIAVMAGAMLERLRLATRLSGNAAAIEQARGFAYAAETMATTRVTDLLGRSPDRVTLAGGWSDRPFPLPLPGAGGLAVARVTDGGNCFNLNGLVTRAGPGPGPGPGVYVSEPTQRAQFARLLRLTGTSTQLAEGIAAAAADWIDSDQDQQANGAEDGIYLAREQPYRTAGNLMADPSELRAVNGVTPAIYAQVRPWLCTLPVAEPSRINVNTVMPEQAPLVAMLAPDTMSVAMARSLILRRPPLGYAAASDFWKPAAQQGGVTVGPAEGQTGVTTRWFALRIDVTAGSAQLQEQALIDATHLPARLAARQWGDPT